MKVLPLVSLAVALATAPASSDITIGTRSSYGPNVNGAVDTVTVQLKGVRQRMVSHTDIAHGAASHTFTTIAQCDIGRAVLINDAARIYALEPLPPRARLLASPTVIRHPMQDTRPIVAIRTIDAKDTGERRSYGPFVARHVVTTTTVERDGTPAVVDGVRDGWYIDLPNPNCEQPGDGATYLALGLVEGSGRVDVRFQGHAKTGFPVQERDRTGIGTSRVERTTELVEFSDAPLAASLFEIPDGYKPALQLPFGGLDLTRPDTLWNRASAYWSLASGWVQQWWR